MNADLDSLRMLPLAEKLRIVEAIWKDIATSTETLALPEWMRNEVVQRLEEYEKDPATALTREEVWQRVDEQRG